MRIPIVHEEIFTIEFREVMGYDLPTNDVVEVALDQLSVIRAFYPVTPPVLRMDREQGLSMWGTMGTRYRIEYAEELGDMASWVPVATVTLSNGLNRVVDAAVPLRAGGFYRAVWVPEP